MARRSSSLWGWGHWAGRRNDVGIVSVDQGYCVMNAGYCNILSFPLNPPRNSFQNALNFSDHFCVLNESDDSLTVLRTFSSAQKAEQILDRLVKCYDDNGKLYSVSWNWIQVAI
nr:hypothetical protein Iba_chr03aCG11180 [Ipomoea batatas]GMD86415.1 hypothetical protein Iba_chr14bCG5840 [Ipomoea batatas]